MTPFYHTRRMALCPFFPPVSNTCRRMKQTLNKHCSPLFLDCSVFFNWRNRSMPPTPIREKVRNKKPSGEDHHSAPEHCGVLRSSIPPRRLYSEWDKSIPVSSWKGSVRWAKESSPQPDLRSPNHPTEPRRHNSTRRSATSPIWTLVVTERNGRFHSWDLLFLSSHPFISS